MKDRLVSLETRDHIRVRDDDFDMPMLILEDFEIEALPIDNCIISSEFALIRDTTVQKDLALICIEKAKLCLCIGHVISIQYPVLSIDHETLPRPDMTIHSSSRLFPKKWDRDHTKRVLDCDSELSNWLDNLPTQFLCNRSSALEYHKGRSCVFLQRSLVYMMCFAAISVLHEPQSLSIVELGTLQNSCDLQDLSVLRVREASKAIATIGLDLHKLRLERYLPTTVVAILVLAMAHHLLDMQSPLNSNGENSIERSYQCVQLLEELQDTGPAAGYEIKILGAAVRKSNFGAAVEGMEKRSETPRSTMGSIQTTTMEKENEILEDLSPLNALGRAVKIEATV